MHNTTTINYPNPKQKNILYFVWHSNNNQIIFLGYDEKHIYHLLQLKEVKPFMDLFKDMTEIDYRDRISPEEAHQRYQNLIL